MYASRGRSPMIIFTGVAGAGKSVQGRMLADEMGYPWLSTGEFLRMLIAGERRKAMLKGELLSDQEMIAVMQKILNLIPTDEEFILDGFPRTADQAEWLLAQVKAGLLDITAVFRIEASREVVKMRLLGRGRADDHHDAIEERFREYQETMVPILRRFEAAGIKVHLISGEQPVADVHDDIVAALGL